MKRKNSCAHPLAVGTAGLALLVPALVSAAPASAAPTSGSTGLPTVTSGVRPGPPVLYAAAPKAPQLENRNPRFAAAPLLVSGTEAYVGGEFVHQDYLYDDYGPDSDLQRGGSTSERSGDLEYPADPTLAGNGADIVEVRVAPGASDVVYRITLNSLQRTDAAVVALAFDTDRNAVTGSSSLPGDPGAPFPGTDQVLTVWGSGAEHTALSATGARKTTPVAVNADLEANQLTVTVPRSVSDPRGTWRTTVAAGVNAGNGTWAKPVGAANGIYNLAFRYNEPVQTTNTPADVNQSIALAEDAPTRYARDIDFTALDRKVNRSTVPTTGRQIRLFPSRLQLGEGRDLAAFPQYKGQLQPYAVYIPTTYRAGTPVPLTLSMHSLGQAYWQYQGGRLFAQQGEERGSVVLSPMGRGPDGWYQHEAEVDVFEAWNDLSRHVQLDPTRTYSSGYSMGGMGTYRLAGLYPDLFARAFTVVGPPAEGIWLPPAAPTGGAETLSNQWLENLRNVPIMNLVGAEDELVPYVGPRAQNLGAPEAGIRGLEQLGYDYRFLTFPAAEHFTLALLGYDFPMARDFLGKVQVDRDPAHVTFARVPGSDDAALALVHDHAYWVSAVQANEGQTKGVVDARSRAFGKADPTVSRVTSTGVAQLPYQLIGNAANTPAAIPAQNVLDLQLTGVRTSTLDLTRARLSTRSPLRILAKADTASELALTGSFSTRTTVTRNGAPLAGVQVSSGRLVLPVAAGEGEYVVQSGK